nr:RNA-directed DNA polymerase, eukaryota, reverse transcriptase zinc-binding domain protein [Tanacetum cinerariifolium]
MESIHVSFQRVVDASLFNGIKLDSSLQISHLFYADDAIFIGQWSQCNIDTIIRVLDVFYRASGLRINMNKSNRMGLSVDSNKVKHAAAKIGCLVLKTPFNYLGSRVGNLMSRIQSWHDVTEGMHTRLSKWKLKTLSIEGRLTLLKSVLGAIPIYHMSIYKVPMKNLLWVRVVKALHGEDGKIEKKIQPRYPSTWLNIINEIESLKLHGIDLVASKLSHGGLEFSFRRNLRGGVEQTQFEGLKKMVEGVTLSNSNDRWSWSLVGSGDFSVSSVRKLIDNAILPKGISKTRWIKEVPIKINVYA